MSSGSAPRYQGRQGDGTGRWRVEFYKPVILICPSSSRRMLKERGGGNRCFKRDETHGRARRPQGSRPGPWAAVSMLAGGRQVTCCSQTWPLDHCFPSRQLLLGQEHRHIRSVRGAKGSPMFLWLAQQAHTGDCRCETLSSPGCLSCMNGPERVRKCPGLCRRRAAQRGLPEPRRALDG